MNTSSISIQAQLVGKSTPRRTFLRSRCNSHCHKRIQQPKLNLQPGKCSLKKFIIISLISCGCPGNSPRFLYPLKSLEKQESQRERIRLTSCLHRHLHHPHHHHHRGVEIQSHHHRVSVMLQFSLTVSQLR